MLATIADQSNGEGTLLGELVRRYRATQSRLRHLRIYGGRTAATTNAIARHDATLREIEHALDVCGHQHVVGALAEEAALLDRISTRRHEGVSYPDLAQRLHILRARIRSAR